MEQMNVAQLAEKNLIMPEGDFYKFTNLSSQIRGLNPAPFVEGPHLKSSLPTLVIENGKLRKPDFSLKGVSITEGKFSPQGRPHPLSQIHSELAQGIRIKIDKNALVEKPIRILHLNTTGRVAAFQVNIEAGMHSQATILEENFGTGALLGETQVLVQAGARLEHIQLNDLGPESFFHGAGSAEVDRDGTYRNFVFHIAGKLNRRNLDLKLKSPGSHGESYNLFLTNGHEQSDINTVIEHLSEDSTSEQLTKGILDEESRGIFTGRIHIFPKAQRVNSGQLSKNLLLSKKAQVHSLPQLEIFADDVKCSHGSTTGQLSPEELFYFEARGIPSDRARTLLAHGFGLEIVLKMSHPEARERVSAIILDKLKTKFNLGGKA